MYRKKLRFFFRLSYSKSIINFNLRLASNKFYFLISVRDTIVIEYCILNIEYIEYCKYLNVILF